jgi:GT2 family glycosyltransferase
VTPATESKQALLPARQGVEPDLSVVMVTWNSLEITTAALDSIRAHTAGVDYEVFVIDNGTTKDDTVAVLPRRFPWVRFMANPENRGFTKANNQGIREARGRYVLLLNSDTIQTENALGEAVKYLDAHPEVGALGIMHRNHDGERTFQPSCHEFPSPWRDTLAMLGIGGRAPTPPVVEERDVDWVCGSFLLRGELLQALPGKALPRLSAWNAVDSPAGRAPWFSGKTGCGLGRTRAFFLAPDAW